MNKKIWDVCVSCDAGCCKSDIVQTIYATPEEKMALPKINCQYPCYYLTKDNMCSVHNIRPLDCRMHPFDIISENGVYYWVVWNNDEDCPLLLNERDRFEEYLQDIERTIMPRLRAYLKECDDWMDGEYKEKYKYEIIREVRFVD